MNVLIVRANRLIEAIQRFWSGFRSPPEVGRAPLELKRLKSLPRFQPTETDLLGRPIQILDAEAFLGMYEEIFVQGIYDFRSSRETPYIIDGGAHIGISVMRFKHLYPGCRIIAFEPDPRGFKVLQCNVGTYENVTLVEAALAESEATVDFVSDGSWGSRVAQDGDAPIRSRVRSLRLRPYLQERVDLLKLNVEGSEIAVIQDCADLLSNVDQMVVEYHSFTERPQGLHLMLEILFDCGFRTYIRSVHGRPLLQPLLGVPSLEGMDLQLYVYAYRPGLFRDLPKVRAQ